MEWNQDQFDQFIIEHQVIGFFSKPITLKSGRESHWYVNWRNIAEDVYLIDELSDFVISYVQYKNFDLDCFFGVPEGATKLGILCQYKWATSKPDYRAGKYVLPMGRGKPKDHGALKDRNFLGIPRGQVVVIEDVTTTGGSMFAAAKNLMDLDVDIIAAIGLTNRNELRGDGKSVKELFDEIDIDYYAMSNAIDLLPKLNPQQKIAKKVQAYFKQYGTQEIDFNL
ncbi:MAG: hypothetical protein ACOC44_19620 [Promethearchaeia archaeon]